MESKVNPDSIQERADKVATDNAATEKAVADKAAADTAAKATADATAKAEADKAATTKTDAVVKPTDKVEHDTTKIPNDPAELRKWNTKVSQDNAALRDEIKGLKAAVEKMMKKPIDYKELAKNPDSLKSHIEAERAEAIAEMQDKLQEATTRAVANETTVERIKREQDITNFPEWKRVFPLIQNLASNMDARINFNKRPGEVLDDMYQLALQLSPVQAPVAPVAPVVPAVPAKTQAEIDAEIAAKVADAEKRGFEKAQESMRAEQNGAGIGSAGKGGRRSSGVTKEALHGMPLGELKKLISQE